MMSNYNGQVCDIAQAWKAWCGDTRWSRAMRQCERMNLDITWFCGYPQSPSAIPLCFLIKDATGNKLNNGSTLRELERIATLGAQ